MNKSQELLFQTSCLNKAHADENPRTMMSAGKTRRGPVKELGRGGVQEYLKEQIELHGGAWDHFTSPGKKGVPDLIVTWPMRGWAKIDFIETKTTGGKLEPWQERDHARRRKLGCYVVVLWDFAGVDRYIQLLTGGYRKIQPGEPMYDFVQANKHAGNDVCDSSDHNGPGDCSNPYCFKHTA